jgi:hypothetical protein
MQERERERERGLELQQTYLKVELLWIMSMTNIPGSIKV